MPVGAKRRATPSEVMMKGCTRSGSPGLASGRISGTSAPPQLLPFHSTSLRVASHGLPSGALDAASHLVARLRPGAGEDPTARGSAAVVSQQAESGDLLAGLGERLGLVGG